jgi:SAM-dependent methyltransferase
MQWIVPAPDRRALALDLACGAGRHIDPIQAKGYRVVAADVSIVALRRLSNPRNSPGVDSAHLSRVLFDADTWPFKRRAFALIVQTNFLARAILDAMKASVAPDGMILIDTFAGKGGPGQPGPSNPAFRLRKGELVEAFKDWEILEHAVTENREAILARTAGMQSR